jgi:hypothetical protein
LVDNTTDQGVWVQKISRPDNSKMLEQIEDWLGFSTAGQDSWSTAQNGAGASATLSLANVNRVGSVFMTTGSTATGIVTMWKNSTGGGIIFGSNKLFVHETSLAIQNLSTATERFRLQFGYLDQSAGVVVQDGVYFEYDEAVSGNFWRLVCSSNSIRTTIVTTVPVTQGAENWRKYRTEVNRSGTRADFFIGGVFVGSIDTNIPVASGRNTGLAYRLAKLVGSNIRPVFLDDSVHRIYINK